MTTSETTRPWHSIDRHEVCFAFDTDAEQGLGSHEAARRLARYGPNAISEEPGRTRAEVFARQFVDVLIWILLVAAAISFAVGEVVDAAAILVIVVLNGVLGYVQEWRAEQALGALRRMLTPVCTVIRDGDEREVDSTALVPGDLVVLETGDRVPADLRLVETVDLQIDEAPLTGESLPVHKTAKPVPEDTALAERASMAWMGTNVTNGRGRGVVVATGMDTQFGRIAQLTQTLGTETTPLQRRLAGLGRQLGAIALTVAAAVSVAGVVSGRPPLEMFLTGISLAVAIVPEGLPAVVTITLALGVRQMVRRNALLRRLQVAEALGSATVICTDKTGTLTRNEMTVTRIWLPDGPVDVTGIGYTPEGRFLRDGQPVDPGRHPGLFALLETGLVCNHARLARDGERWVPRGDPTEAALLVAAAKAGLGPPAEPPVGELSFSSARKRMTVLVEDDRGLVAHTKGAPEVVLARCTRILRDGREEELTDSDRDTFVDAYRRLASDGLRTLALARRRLPDHHTADEIETELTLLGLVGLVDPPRPEVPGALRLAEQAGIRTVVITGDAAETAVTVARKIGLQVDRVVTGPELDDLADAELARMLGERVLFARTSPEHKLRLVQLLQSNGELVAMTGDGVNDAPALKQADIGVAMGIRGTDVAKAAADMILLDDNFASIVGAVEEGRRQYDNIQKFVRYLLSSNTGEVVAVLANILLGGPLILLPVQILWINLVTDGLTAVALGVEPAADDLMRQPPRPAREPILARRAMVTVLALGAYMGLAALWLFHRELAVDAAKAQTMAFTGLVLLELANLFNFRSLRQPIARIGWRSNPWLLAAWVATVGLQVAAVYTPFLQAGLRTVPLGWGDWALLAAVAAPIFVVVEALKAWRVRPSRREALSFRP